MIKFILAPDSFKESMTAKEVCLSMEKGIKMEQVIYLQSKRVQMMK